MSDNLWGNLCDLIQEINQPKDILKAQCDFLQSSLNCLVSGSIKRNELTSSWKNYYSDININADFAYTFTIFSDFIEKYKYDVCTIVYSIKMYPLAVTMSEAVVNELSNDFEIDGDDTIVANDQAEFEKILGSLFQTNEVRQVIRGLVAMAKQEMESKNLPF